MRIMKYKNTVSISGDGQSLYNAMSNVTRYQLLNKTWGEGEGGGKDDFIVTNIPW